MWLVGYEIDGRTHFNYFETEKEARDCLKEDFEYYQDAEIKVKFFLAEVKHTKETEV